MFFLTVAKEDKGTRVLNYAPGPLDTDMQAACRQSRDETLKKAFTGYIFNFIVKQYFILKILNLDK